MALYSLNVNIKSRGNGANAIAAAAYRSGAKLKDYRTGEVKYYRSKCREVVYHDIVLPAGAPTRFKNQEILWNDVEEHTKRRDGQLAREYRIALQNEFTKEDNIDCLNQFAKKLAEDGQIVDISYHQKKGNPHAHLLCPVMSIAGGKWQSKRMSTFKLQKNFKTGELERIPVINPKTGKQKTRHGKKVWVREEIKTQSVEWGTKDYLQKVRALWADVVNKKFKEKQFEIRISEKSYEDRHIDKIPTMHLGPAVATLQKKGIATIRGKQNQLILSYNAASNAEDTIKNEINNIGKGQEMLKEEQMELSQRLATAQQILKRYQQQKAKEKMEKKIRELDFTLDEINKITQLTNREFSTIINLHNEYLYKPECADKLAVAKAIIKRQNQGYIKVPNGKVRPEHNKNKGLEHNRGRGRNL